MITSQFNFATGSGGKQRMIAPLLELPSFQHKRVVIVSSHKELAKQNYHIFSRAACTTALKAIRWKDWPEPTGIILIIDELPEPMLKKFITTIDISKMEVWTINQKGLVSA